MSAELDALQAEISALIKWRNGKLELAAAIVADTNLRFDERAYELRKMIERATPPPSPTIRARHKARPKMVLPDDDWSQEERDHYIELQAGRKG